MPILLQNSILLNKVYLNTLDSKTLEHLLDRNFILFDEHRIGSDHQNIHREPFWAHIKLNWRLARFSYFLFTGCESGIVGSGGLTTSQPAFLKRSICLQGRSGLDKTSPSPIMLNVASMCIGFGSLKLTRWSFKWVFNSITNLKIINSKLCTLPWFLSAPNVSSSTLSPCNLWPDFFERKHLFQLWWNRRRRSKAHTRSSQTFPPQLICVDPRRFSSKYGMKLWPQ